MRLLLLGGTRFVGRALAEAAVDHGAKVTCFNRGRSGADVGGVATVRGDRTVRSDLERVVARGRWDAVVDTGAYTPRDTAMAAQVLADVVDRYVVISTVSVYRHWPDEPVSEESAPWPSRADAAADDPDVALLPEPAAYGTLKAGCEQAVLDIYGHRSSVLRPGLIVGRYDYKRRLEPLLGRAAEGGRMLVAGDPGRLFQHIDVLDLTGFAMHVIAEGRTGVVNVVTPIGHATYGELLGACVEVTGAETELVWVDPVWLAARGVEEWTDLPLWRTPAGTWRVDGTRAWKAGLSCRPLRDTVAETWRWLQRDRSVNSPHPVPPGLDPMRETQILRAWDKERSGRRR